MDRNPEEGEHETVDAGSSTDQHITGDPETAGSPVDEEPTGGTPSHGSSNAVFNATGAGDGGTGS